MNRLALLLVSTLLICPAALAGESETELEVGIGYDDNPFLTPGQAYFDQFALVIIDPVRQSGFFVPARIKGSYSSDGDNRRFIMDYRLRHDAYLDSDTGNADETNARVASGLEWIMAREGRRENTFFVSTYAGYNKEVYYDRDTGVGQVFTAGDASDRYSYLAYGLETGYRHRTGEKIEYALEGVYEARDYDELAGVRSLDQSRMRVSADIKADLTDSVKLYVDYYYQIRNFDERLSRDLTGALLSTNPTLKYLDHDFGLSLRFRPGNVWRMFLDLDYRIRDDDFTGYNDYRETGYRLRSIWRSGEKRLRAAIRFRDRDYDNAFSFDMPTNPVGGLPNPHKQYEILDIDLKGQLPFWGSANIFVELDYRDQQTTDPRYSYDRLQAIAGLVWEF